ncbi:hypothetical protein AB0V79_33065 [Mesorhizobium ciceri]|uniref:DUF6894 family protein n=1 Tax=Mesorhizobium TaxID=68287 RepID=UPI0007A936D4|nr:MULTISPECIES: hypothetical protein [Mesorhizobium]AMY04279.1 hypothetical protein A4R29_31990 [Mesorhizobium ciceri biovar biserrulae]MBZ9887217.1 hypothetical protein [Mesorhizobium sp. BR1-1-3]
MARFFFDLTDDGEVFPDPEGTEIASREAAEDEAARALLEMAKDRMPDGTFREVAIHVRDHTSKLLFTVKVTVELVREPPDR